MVVDEAGAEEAVAVGVVEAVALADLAEVPAGAAAPAAVGKIILGDI